MPLNGILAVLDDVATVANDVAKMAAVATKTSTGVVIDDMAVTAGGMTNLKQDRETAFVMTVGKGSLKNKLLYLVPSALAIQAFVPAAMPWLLLVGGGFLAYEATEKIVHALKKHDHEVHVVHGSTPEAILEYEKQKVAEAIKTDFILSAEIVAISLAAMQTTDVFWLQAVALVSASVLMTIGVYGAVWLLVKLDNFGEWLRTRSSRGSQKLGDFIIAKAPILFRVIGVIGTVAMLAVGGSLVMHGLHEIEVVEHALHGFSHHVEHSYGKVVSTITNVALDMVAAIGTGLIVIGIGATGIPQRIFRRA